MRIMGSVGILVALLASLPAGRAAETEVEGSVAEQVRVAVQAGSGDDLLELAARDNPDPWMTMDVLLGAGDTAAAKAFAAAAPREATRRLPEYVRSWTPRDDEAGTRAALDAAQADGDAASRVARLEALGGAREDALEVRIQRARAYALRAKHALLASAGAFEHAAEIAGRLGWRTAESDGLYQAASSLYGHGRFEESLDVFRRRLAVERSLRDEVGVARGHYGLAVALGQLTRTSAARQHMEKARELIRTTGDHEYRAKILGTDGEALARAGRYAESLASYQEALLAWERIGERPLAARFTASRLRLARARIFLLLNASSMAGQLEAWDEFERYGREAMELAGELGDERLRLAAEAQFTTAQGERHRLDANDLEAEEAFAHALMLQRKLGDRPTEADLLRRLAQTLARQGDYVAALDRLAEATTVVDETGARRLLPPILVNRGACLTQLGEFEDAHEQYMRALDLAVELDLPLVQLDALVGLGDHHTTRGELAEALRIFREVDLLELPHHAMLQQGTRAIHLGRLYWRFRDFDRALEYYEQALAALTDPGDAKRAALARRSIIGIWISQGNLDRARTGLERELIEERKGTNRLATADTLNLLGTVAYRQSRPEDAYEHWKESEALFSEMGMALNRALTQLDLVRVRIVQGQLGDAQAMLDQALEAADHLQVADLLAHVCGVQALMLLRTGDYDEARRWARRGVDQAIFIGRRLAAGEGAEVRSDHLELHETGAVAAARSGHAEDLFFFLESARAATLLESLNGGASLREGSLTKELHDAETAARMAEVRALATYRRARRDGALEKIRTSRQRLDDARTHLRNVVLDIQRKGRTRHSSVLPRPVHLAAARAELAPDEALVLYGLSERVPVALVVRRESERIVHLGKVAPLLSGIGALLTDGEPFVHPEAVEALSAQLVDRLELGKDVRRLLVSPDGELARLPFTLLAPEHEIVLVPSASAWTSLERRHTTRGERVLAFGDPIYTERLDGYGSVALRRGDRGELSRLPGTAVEARAIGDVVRLREQATESRLRADLTAGDRWRAVHLACHGLLDLEHPSFSSLALATDESNDGFLTALDVYRMNVSTDLAVLSGCETGRGQNVGGEGLFGLPRAFLHAGASTVLVSLWPVDDEATQALMTRFYAAWSPKEAGRKPLPAPASLKQAQAWVCAQPKWKHPRFWAGWVLWGRAD